jgi:hypothetical protein
MTSPDTDEKSLLDFFAEFHVTLQGIQAELKATRANRAKEEQNRIAVQPRYVPIERMSSPGAAVTDFQDFGGPQAGRQWIIRLLAAFASPLAANASLVTWYIGQPGIPGPAAGMLPATSARWQFPSVPGFQTFTSDILKVLPNQHLIAGLTGIPAQSNIGLVAAINDVPLYPAVAAVAPV